MSERREPDPERIYLEPHPWNEYEGRQWCVDDVWPVDHGDDRPGGVEYVRADLAPTDDSERVAELVEALRRVANESVGDGASAIDELSHCVHIATEALARYEGGRT